MPTFSDLLASDRFIVTAELNPPKGTDLQPLLRDAERLRGWVDAFNLTDSAGANMHMAPIGAAVKLREAGVEAILQVTGRDRNRIAIQADLLAASALGVRNAVCMGGDPPTIGDHPDAKGVFDLDAVGLLNAMSALNGGKDIAGNELKGATELCPGAVCNPGTTTPDWEIDRMQQKIDAGARFFQTQAVYDPAAAAPFFERAARLGAPVIAGFIVLKSGAMARRLNETLPGVSVPEALIEELDAASDKAAKSIELAGAIIRELGSLCRGVHIMAIGWEGRIPAMLAAAGIARRE